MRVFEPAKRVLTFLALALMLALASPGVNAVRAEGGAPEAKAAASSQADSCSSEAPVNADAEVQAFIEELQREQMARIDAGDDTGPILLNNRGYNYGPGAGIRLDEVFAEQRRSAD